MLQEHETCSNAPGSGWETKFNLCWVTTRAAQAAATRLASRYLASSLPYLPL